MPSGYVFFRDEDNVLLLRRANTGYHDGDYGVPAGHIEEGELGLAGTIREVQEEVGVRLKPEQLTFVHTMYRQCGDHVRIDLFFEATAWDGTIVNAEPEKCDDLSWFALDALPDNVIPYMQQALEKYRVGERYSEFVELEDRMFEEV